MKCYHLTPIRNLKSIQSKGLIPCIPYLWEHKEYIEEHGASKVIYLTPEDQWEDEFDARKYAEDFVYWNTLHKPVTMILKDLEKVKAYDGELELARPKLDIKNEVYVTLEIDGSNIGFEQFSMNHSQVSNDRIYSAVHDKYIHAKKTIFFSSKAIEYKHLKPIGVVEFEVEKHGFVIRTKDNLHSINSNFL